MLSTTMNINRKLFNQLAQISEKYNITIAALIKKILKHVFANLNGKKLRTDLTHYQKRRSGTKWKCFHIDFSENECMQNFSCRFKHRISLSHVLLVGFVLFIKDVIEELENGCSEINTEILISYTAYKADFYKLIEQELEIFKIHKNPPE